MNIEQVKQFIKQLGWGMLATTDGRKVGVSAMGGLAEKLQQKKVSIVLDI